MSYAAFSLGLRARLRVLLRLSIPLLALWLSLLVLRQQLVTEVNMTMPQAFKAGLLFGYYNDWLAVMLAANVVAVLWAVTGLSSRISWPVMMLVVFIASLSNVLYFRFFGMRLDWWIVALQWSDLGVVGGSATQLSLTWPVALSTLFALLSLGLGVAKRHALAPLSFTQAPLKRRGLALVKVVPLVLLTVLLWRLPRVFDNDIFSNIVSDNVIRAWVSQWENSQLFAGAGTEWADSLQSAAALTDRQAPARALMTYRDFANPAAISTPIEAPVDGLPRGSEATDVPLVRKLRADPETTRALRARFGLPADGPIHVILLFLESVRVFELEHPAVAPEIFPGLNQVLREHAIWFQQAYSSSFTAGQTVRGQFSTQCSMLPNITGAATYIAHATLNVRCLPQLLYDNGYATVWMNGYKASYHNKQTFEMLHGMQRFYDETAFQQRGVTKRLGRWGLADGPFLQESIDLFSEIASEGKPVYVNMLTISTHHPYAAISEAPLSAALNAATAGNENYRNYLSQLRYSDMSVSAFFAEFFKRPEADRTLFVVLGDHSTPVTPHIPLTPVQQEELRFRILMAVVTKNMPHPEVIQAPVHQVDVAPTIARTVGATGVVAWVGQGLFSGAGRPWVYQKNHEVSYRLANRACYTARGGAQLGCFDLTGKDPLFDEALAPLPVDLQLDTFFRDVITANMQAIVFNAVMPKHE